METMRDYFLGSKITVDGDCSREIKRRLLLARKAMTPGRCIKKQRRHSVYKGLHSQSCDFSSSHVRMWELDHKECWTPKNWCFRIVVLVKIPESPLDSKEIHPVHPKGDQPWIFIGGTDAEVKLQYFGHLLWWADSLGKTLMLGKIEGRRRRGQQRLRWSDSVTSLKDMNLSKLQEILKRAWQETCINLSSPNVTPKNRTAHGFFL